MPGEDLNSLSIGHRAVFAGDADADVRKSGSVDRSNALVLVHGDTIAVLYNSPAMAILAKVLIIH
jgi:hypothetical protein